MENAHFLALQVATFSTHMSFAAIAKLIVERRKATSNISKGASEKHLGEEGRKLFMDENCPIQSRRVASSVCLMIPTNSRKKCFVTLSISNRQGESEDSHQTICLVFLLLRGSMTGPCKLHSRLLYARRIGHEVSLFYSSCRFERSQDLGIVLVIECCTRK